MNTFTSVAEFITNGQVGDVCHETPSPKARTTRTLTLTQVCQEPVDMDERSIVTNIVVTIHSKDRRRFESYVSYGREMGVGDGFITERNMFTARMERLGELPVARFSAKTLREEHERAVAAYKAATLAAA